MDIPQDNDPRLAEIEDGLVHDDPRLAARLEALNQRLLDEHHETPYRHAVAIGLMLLVVVAILAALVIAIANSSDAPPPPPTRPGTSAPAAPGTTP